MIKITLYIKLFGCIKPFSVKLHSQSVNLT